MQFPFLETFPAYVKSLSGHHDLWQLEYRTDMPDFVPRAKKIVELLLSSRNDATMDAEHVNQILSGLEIPLTVEEIGAGFSIGGIVEGERVEVARLSR